MTVMIAHQTLAAIEGQIASDQGSRYRQMLEQVIPHIGDAYQAGNFPFRSHMGASGLGGKCGREIWLKFRWAKITEHGGRLLRLFNRGHLEEARFIAMLLSIGVQVYQQDENGKQFRIKLAGGHSGGSGDGVLINVPDLPAGTPCLGEFKTANEKSFNKLKKDGVKENKWVHYVQMQLYMGEMGIPVALYMCVNKNNDELYAEIIHYDSKTHADYAHRAERLVYSYEAPDKISKSPAWFECRYCDMKPICHDGEEVYRSCRMCRFSVVNNNGTWDCANPVYPMENLTKEQQFNGCSHWENLLDHES